MLASSLYSPGVSRTVSRWSLRSLAFFFGLPIFAIDLLYTESPRRQDISYTECGNAAIPHATLRLGLSGQVFCMRTFFAGVGIAVVAVSLSSIGDPILLFVRGRGTPQLPPLS